MAALIKHVLSKVPCRTYAKNIPFSEVDSVLQKIKSRGFLRNLKEYQPPEDVTTRLSAVCERVLGAESSNSDYCISDPDTRFKLFNECFDEFKHGIPNSLLYAIKTVGDLQNFYLSPVNTTAPYDVLKQREDLPENLYLQPDYIRFHPDTDTMFKGQTAFPQTSTIVTGLRTRKKYKGFTSKSPYEET